MGLSKRKKISCESQYCVKQTERNSQYLNTCSLPPGQTFLIKNSQSFLLNSANLIVKFPCALISPSLSFLNNSNTSILNPSRANLQLCTKCKFSKRKIPQTTHMPFKPISPCIYFSLQQNVFVMS